MSVKVTGLAEVLRDLERTLPAQASRIQGEMNLEVAKAIAEGAQERAPRHSGRLIGAIKARRSPDDEAAAEVYVRRGKGGAFYWRFLEFGQGPDGVEHAMFLKAREAALSDSRFVDRFKRKLTSLLKKV